MMLALCSAACSPPPKSYAECVLANVKGTETQMATQAKLSACREIHPYTREEIAEMQSSYDAAAAAAQEAADTAAAAADAAAASSGYDAADAAIDAADSAEAAARAVERR